MDQIDKHLIQPYVVESNIHFLRPIAEGTLAIFLSETSVRRLSSLISFSAAQDGNTGETKPAMIGTLVMGDLSSRVPRACFKSDWTLEPEPQSVNLRLLAKDRDPNWRAVPEIPFARGRSGMNHVLIHIPRSRQRRLFSADLWMRARNGQRFTQVMLPYLSAVHPILLDELFNPGIWENPSLSEQAKRPYDVVINSITCDIKHLLPPDGIEWVFARIHTKAVMNARYDVDVVLQDPKAQVILGARFIIYLIDLNAKEKRSQSRI